MITTEQLYSEWHKQTVFYNTGKYPRSIKNFSKAKESDNWAFFERFKIFINKNSVVDYKIFIQSLADFYEGWFHPKHLNSQKSIRLYKSFISRNNVVGKDKFKSQIKSNLVFVFKFCKDNNITTLDGYLLHNHKLLPSVLKHYKQGNINLVFFALINNFIDILQNYDPSFVEGFLGSSFNIDYQQTRYELLKDNKLRSLSSKIHRVFKEKL